MPLAGSAAAMPAMKRLQTYEYTYLVGGMTPIVNELLDIGT
jgi:hypothetical protein